MSEPPKLDILDKPAICNQDAIAYLEEVLEQVRNDPEVTGVHVMIEKAGTVEIGASYTDNRIHRLGVLEYAKLHTFRAMADGT